MASSFSCFQRAEKHPRNGIAVPVVAHRFGSTGLRTFKVAHGAAAIWKGRARSSMALLLRYQ
jgi:hypothetical protein